MASDASGHRVLVVTATFPPDGAVGSLRTLRLLRHLARSGSDVEVLTISPDTYRAGTVTDPALLAQVPDGVRVTRAAAIRPVERLWAWLRRGRTGRAHDRPRRSSATVAEAGPPPTRLLSIRRLQRACSALLSVPDREVSWIVPAVVRGCGSAKRTGRPDIIYSSGPPYSAHVAAACLAAVLRRPWVADFRDPWARAPWREDRFRFEKRAWSMLERGVVRRTDAAVFVTEANRADFAAHHGEALARRFHVVPNGCDAADFDGLVPRPSADRFVLLHAGSLYGARDPSSLFRAIAEAAAAETIDRGAFRIRLIGRIGIPGVDLPGLIRQLGLEDLVEIIPHMPRRMVLQEMLDASALLIVQPVTRVSIPGKLYEYLAARRPILALAEPDGDTAALVNRSGAGVVVPPADETGIRHALAQLLAGGVRRLDTDPSLYDGALRASELGAILQRAASRGQVHGASSSTVPISTKPS